MPRVLVVDDDVTVAEVVIGYLGQAGIDADHAADGLAALAQARDTVPDLVVLDLMLPGLDGLEVCRQLRIERPELPVVMLTALGTEEDRVLGLQIGADDYVTKPFSPRELVLRIQSVLRRTSFAGGEEGKASTETPVLIDDDLVLDPSAHRVTRAGVELMLTAREFNLLAYLMAHSGEAFSRDQLMKQVWDWDFGDTSTITVHVRRLREKIESNPAAPTRLVTVWGVGYRWDGTVRTG